MKEKQEKRDTCFYQEKRIKTSVNERLADMNNSTEYIDKFRYPCGIGGWLLIPICLISLQVLIQVAKLGDSTHSNGLFVKLISVFFAVWGLLCLYLIFKRSKATRIWCSRYFFFSAAYPIFVAAMGSPDGRMFTDEYPFIVFAFSLGISLLWGIYFLKSSRVARTFNAEATTIQPEKVSEEVEMQRSKLLFRRFAAYTFDMIVFWLLSYLSGIAGIARELRGTIVLLYLAFLLFSQTPGKKLFSLQVLRNDGRVLTKKQYIFRSVNALFYLYGPILIFYYAALIFLHPIHPIILSMIIIAPFCATFGFQYCKVLKSGQTSYDSVYDTKVVAQPLTSIQKAFAIFVSILGLPIFFGLGFALFALLGLFLDLRY